MQRRGGTFYCPIKLCIGLLQTPSLLVWGFATISPFSSPLLGGTGRPEWLELQISLVLHHLELIILHEVRL